MARTIARSLGRHGMSVTRGRGFRSSTALIVVTGVVAVTASVFEDARPLRALAIGLCAALLLTIAEAYSPSGARRVRRTSSAYAIAIVAAALGVGWDTNGFGLEPVHAITATAVAACLIWVVRTIGRGRWRDRILVVGSGYAADAFAHALAREGRSEIVGRIDDSNEPGLLGDLDAFEAVVTDNAVTTVVFAYSHAPDARLALLAARSRELDLTVGIVPRLFEEFDRRLRVQNSAGVPLLVVDPWPHETCVPVVSRIADVIIAGTLLLLLLPVWLVLAVAIFIEEPGPVLYRARRVGRHGHEFEMFKFRKMRRDATGSKLTLAGDERFTRVGRLLALTKLDELPQLINVMRGEMGLVGPRPEDPSFVEEFRNDFNEILHIRPGITGLSQIQYRNESELLVGDDFDELYRNELLPRKLDLDRYYARRRSLALDARILTWTAIAVVAGARIRRNELTASVAFERHDAAQELSAS